MVWLGGDEILFDDQSFVEPPAWYRTGPSGRPARTGLHQPPPVDFSDVEVSRELAVSKDGTKVPVDVMRRRGTPRNGENPTLLSGYGGYSISERPAYNAMRKAWLEQGGVWAVAGLRGGAEFGDDWHQAGKLLRKQNVFDDFAAAARQLVASRWTRPNRLAIEGWSNGGLLMGVSFTQHPELFGAVIAHVGIYDMLRWERSSNGAFNVTEFGSVEDPAQFRYLFAYSPYHHVVDGKAYPPVLFLTGANDPRVDPMHSRKMAARLQAATGGKTPVLLRTSASSGHGIGSSLDEKIGETLDVYAFLFDRLGVTYRPVGGK
jgi:prolyl oligopeptidase